MTLDFMFIICLVISLTDCSLYETDDLYSWTEASHKCNLATPGITLDSEGYRIDGQDESWTGTIWTGYYMTLQEFEYIGCVNIPSRKPDFTNHLNTPGFCYTSCGQSNVVGLKDTECFCINDESFDNQTMPYCVKICEAQKGIVCGGHQHMSLYKISKGNSIVSDDNLENSCLGLGFVQDSKIFRWQNCSDYLRPLCSYINSETDTDDRHYPWDVASNECFQDQKVPVPYISALESQTVLTGVYWTGTVRSKTIHKYNGKHEAEGYIRYGYLHKSENNLSVLAFTNGNEKMKVLCTNETTEEEKSSVAGYVILVLAVVLIVVGVGVFFLWRRRKFGHTRHHVSERQKVEQNEYITPVHKEDDDRIYSEVIDNYELDKRQWATDDGYEIPVRKPVATDELLKRSETEDI